MFSRRNFYGKLFKICASAAARPAVVVTAAAPFHNVRQFHEVTGDIFCPSKVQGIDYLNDPRLNKGLAFTLEERHVLGIHGLQPSHFRTMEEQLEVTRIAVNNFSDALNKFIYLMDMQDRNEHLFFRFLAEHIDAMMPIVYTPTVGLACQRFGLVYRRPRGLFITINDRGHVFDVIKNWPEPDVRAIAVTDGENILGLGDLGAHGLGSPVSKLTLYTALAGIKPHQCLPIQLDVGTNNMDLLEDPLYVGLRQKRVVGPEYDDLIDEFMAAIVKRYSQNTLVQFEDFATDNAFRFLKKYIGSHCVFNADIQGTAAVIVAGLLASMRLTNKPFIENTFLFVGAGRASIGIADLVVVFMVSLGLSVEVARSRIFMVDVEGLVTTSRKEGFSTASNIGLYAQEHLPMKDLAEMVAEFKPTVLIGATGSSGIFTQQVQRAMADNNERPVIAAISNPATNAECTAEEAYQNTDSRVIFISGSPFPPFTVNGRTYSPGQCTRAYVFPGFALGVIATGTHHVSTDMLVVAARELSETVSQDDLERGSMYPHFSKIREVSMRIAIAVTQCAYDKGLASTYPEPRDKRKYLEEQLYEYNYESSMPKSWIYPRMPYIQTREIVPTQILIAEELQVADKQKNKASVPKISTDKK